MSRYFKIGESLPVVEKTVTQKQIDDYAVASGDFNPIHVDHEFAANAQFGGTVAHGMLIAAAISEMMTLAYRESWLQGGRLKIRFRSPVYPGDKITTFGEVKNVRDRDGVTEIACTVGVSKQDGEAAITGEATITSHLAS